MRQPSPTRSHVDRVACSVPVALCLLVAASAVHAGPFRFPNVPLTTQDGEQVQFYDDLVENKVVVINFVYTSCKDSCPAETARLKQVYNELGDRVGKDIFMYSISIDPDHDTPEVLKDFTERYRIGPGWLFLTGTEEDTTLLRKRLGLYLDDIQQDDSIDHNISFIVGNDKTGKWIKRSPFDDPRILANLIGYEMFDGTIQRTGKSYAEAPAVEHSSRGAYLYRTRCISCHSIGKGDDVLGPDLAGVTQKREKAWLERWLANPGQMIEDGDPVAVALFERYNQIMMPNLRLDPEDIAALIHFLDQQTQELARNTPKPGGRDPHSEHAAHAEHAADASKEHHADHGTHHH
jgi:protein SCO1/2